MGGTLTPTLHSKQELLDRLIEIIDALAKEYPKMYMLKSRYTILNDNQ